MFRTCASLMYNVVSIDFWQYKIEVAFHRLPVLSGVQQSVGVRQCLKLDINDISVSVRIGACLTTNTIPSHVFMQGCYMYIQRFKKKQDV